MHHAPKRARLTTRKSSLELADIVREHGEAFRRSHPLKPEQSAVLRAIASCRTAVLGGHLEVCQSCGDSVPVYNSCRNRHCPKCQCLAAEKWIEAREARLLPTHHFHVVFTLPAELRFLARFRPSLVFDLLFSTSAKALQKLGDDEKHLGGLLGVTSVLHTWTRDLRFHPHVHCIVSGGGLSRDGERWVSTRPNFLFPVLVLGEIFRGKFLDALRRAHRAGNFAGFDDFEDPEGFDRLMAKLASKRWVVYVKETFFKPEHVVRYLGRYTHRVGIANSRLVSLVEGCVTFRTKNGETATLAAQDFLARFVQHVLPKGYVKIRHFGLLAPANVETKLERARELLGGTNGDTIASEPPVAWVDRLNALTGRDVRRCDKCGGPLVRTPLPRTSKHRERGPP